MIADVQHDPRTQRRGRIVIVTMIVGFLVVCAALGWFLVHREQEEARLAELTRPGLLTVGVPPLELEIEELSALPDHRGLVATYRHSDGEAVSQLRLLNLRAGSDPNLCELLIGVEPALADRCDVTGLDVSAKALGPTTILEAEGQLRESTLVVLVGHPTTFDDERLRAYVDAAELMSVADLLRLTD